MRSAVPTKQKTDPGSSVGAPLGEIGLTSSQRSADTIRSVALPSRTPIDGTRFSELPVDRTGFDFGHNWAPPPGYQLEIYRESLPGGGICVGDIDRDGLPDVFISQPNVGSRMYRNVGRFRFEDVTSSTVGDLAHALGATFVDIDNDNDLDLFVCNNERPNQLFLNDGKMGFVECGRERGLDFTGASIMMSFADYDRDGDLDGYLVTNRKEPHKAIPEPRRLPDGRFHVDPDHSEYHDSIVRKNGTSISIHSAQYDHLFQNNGDGTFTEVTKAAGMAGNYFGLSASWFDYDRDGWPDLYVANDFYSPDQLYHNNGDGTFTDVASTAFPHTPWYSMGCDVADINNDGWLDLMGSDMSGSSHYSQKASMGNMSSNAWFLDHPTPRQYARNALYVNTGTGTFLEMAQLAGVANTDWTWSLKFADLDEDGWTDLYVTNGVYRDWTNTDTRNRSNNAKTKKERMKIWLNSPQKRDENFAFRNGGDYRFESVGADWGLKAERVSSGAVMTDLDLDGDLDLIVNNAKEAASIYRNNTANTNRVVIQLEGKNSNRNGIGTVLQLIAKPSEAGASREKQTRILNCSQGYVSSNEPIVHFGLGEAARIDELEIRWPSGCVQKFRDLPGNHRFTIKEPGNEISLNNEKPMQPTTLFAQSELAVEHREQSFDDFSRQPLLPNRLSQLGPGIACADIDADGDTDIFLGGAAGQPGQLLVNQDGEFYSQFAGPWQTDAPFEDMGVLFFDSDSDGDSDLYVASGGFAGEVGDAVLTDRLYLNDGTGEFSLAPEGTLPTTPANSGSTVNAADFDRDGDLDLFVGGRVIPGQFPLPPKSQLLRNENGRFVDVVAESAPSLDQVGMVTAAIWSDVDADGWIDLLATLEWGNVKLFRNQQGSLVDATEQAGFSSGSGWHNSIAGGDFDGDGDVDFVVGNNGWNTKYHASNEKPSLLYYGDFEKSGRMRLVEAEYEDSTLFPIRGKSCSTNAMPFLGGKFEKFHDFAVASLQDIYTPTCLETSHRYSANRLDSGVWLNDGSGQFTFLSLPTLAQVAPVFGIVVGEFDNDNKLDVFLAQNFFGPQLETGRADGGIGLLLHGNGDGTFRPVAPRDSGVVIPGDAKSALVADLDNDAVADLLIATNDGPVHKLKLNATQSDARRSLRLAGKRGNSIAIGSRVTIRFSDGTAKTSEIYGGSGYLSQSAAEVFYVVPNGVRVDQIVVRWPTGEESTTNVDEQQRQISIVQP